MEFKKITIEDRELLTEILAKEQTLSCEDTFINLYVWQSMYTNMYAYIDGILIIKSTKDGRDTFRLPFGDDFEKGMALIREYSGEEYPVFWIQAGVRCNRFMNAYSQYYDVKEVRDAYDYIYLREDLTNLSGKKYHSKRNHISAFSKAHDWHYEPITGENIDKVRICAEKWYAGNSERIDNYMLTEKAGIAFMLSNMEQLEIKGGAITVGDDVVAFTLGSAVNDKVFDVHIEKALPDYATAYTIICHEFVCNELRDYLYINREDDMGLEGLRKAKLSYRPSILLEKYSCTPR